MTGDYLGEEPCCLYEPNGEYRMMKAGEKPGRERQPFGIRHSPFNIRYSLGVSAFIHRSWAEVPFM
jgi:hypothetical protein